MTPRNYAANNQFSLADLWCRSGVKFSSRMTIRVFSDNNKIVVQRWPRCVDTRNPYYYEIILTKREENWKGGSWFVLIFCIAAIGCARARLISEKQKRDCSWVELGSWCSILLQIAGGPCYGVTESENLANENDSNCPRHTFPYLTWIGINPAGDSAESNIDWTYVTVNLK